MLIKNSFYIVSEFNQVIITQFGEPMGEPITSPGIHFKMPFIQKANFFEKRLLEWEGDANRIQTRDKKSIWIETFCIWRISDALKYFQRVKDEYEAHSRLDDFIDGETRNAVTNYDLIEIVRSSNQLFEKNENSPKKDQPVTFTKISLGRGKITKIIMEKVNKVVTFLGIEIVDIQIKRIHYYEKRSDE